MQSGKALLATAALAFVLAAGALPASAQNVVDGFSGNAITGATNFYVTSGHSSTHLFEPLSTGGTYTIHLGANATIDFGSGPLSVAAVGAFYQLYTTSADPNSTASGIGDPRTGTTTSWTADTVKSTGPDQWAWGWVDSSNGSPTYGNGSSALLSPGSLGTFTFTSAHPVATDQSVFFGFDVKLANGEVLPNGSNTGKVYFNPSGSGNFVPEPAFYQMSSLLLLGGVGLFRLRRARRTA